ncbi:MAG: DUF2254 domain-containing protein [Desulforhopalus sp.]
MKTKLTIFWESLRTSFWFIPALMVITAITMSFSIITVDNYFTLDTMSFAGFLYSVSPEGARSILSTIAGSMMTVAGVTFSITIVVLNLASSQFGPRLLRNFIQDRSTQFVLGTFVATFIYCLLVLRSVRTAGADIYVPNFAVTFAVILALLNVGVLIFFIHHTAMSIQADEVVAGVSRELRRNIRRIFPDELSENNEELTKKMSELQQENRAHQQRFDITARRNGYIQAIDIEGLFSIAKKNEYLIYVLLRPGQFVVNNGRLAVVSCPENVDEICADTIADTIIIGNQRSSEQDIEYSIHQLVEVAVRALSPGINDPYTAIACIDKLGSALGYLANREFPSPSYFDDEGHLYLKTKPFTYTGVLNASFNQIRQYGRTSMAVTIRLLEILTLISAQTRRTDQREAIYRQATMVLEGSRANPVERHDQEDLLERFHQLLFELNKSQDTDGTYELPDQLATS